MSGADGRGTTPGIDTSKPHPARMYDWFLGGKDNYPVDEELGRQMLAAVPQIPAIARMNRAFMRRSTRWLAERGIRQFLDVGTGIPTEPNLHQIAQAVAPETHVVYCDNDPIVLAHAEALLTGTPEGAVDFLLADARDPDRILEHAAKILDLDRPVALSLIALLHFITDEDGGRELVDRLKSALAPGSYLVMSHFGYDFQSSEEAEDAGREYEAKGLTFARRDRAAFTRFFDGFEIVAPGVVLAEEWYPELGERDPGQEKGVISSCHVAVGHRP